MKAQCLCGDIEVHVDHEHHTVGVCHCTICRRWGGGPMFAVDAGRGVRFSGAVPATFRSSDWAERGFCPRCGTHLFYHLLPTGEYSLPAGLFQDQPFDLTQEIFIDHKPAYYALANETRKLTGQQVFDQYASEHGNE
ncbi:GFA family protein [Chitinibacteraceae bacterium HSL-7]